MRRKKKTYQTLLNVDRKDIDEDGLIETDEIESRIKKAMRRRIYRNYMEVEHETIRDDRDVFEFAGNDGR